MKKEEFDAVQTDSNHKKRKGKSRCGVGCALAVTLLGNQLWESGALAWAETAEWEGTTQISTREQYANLDTEAVSLVIEEVYAETGSYVQEGQSILKITEESYQEALDYYRAAILYAQNELVSAQMEYDIAMRDAESALELARAEALQAEFTREQQRKELEETLQEHEEIQAELEDTIEEIAENIEAGSYTSSGNSTGSSSSQKSSSSGKKSASSEKEQETESEMETGREQQPETSETEEEIPLETETERETESENAQTEKNQLELWNRQIEEAKQEEGDVVQALFETREDGTEMITEIWMEGAY